MAVAAVVVNAGDTTHDEVLAGVARAAHALTLAHKLAVKRLGRRQGVVGSHLAILEDMTAPTSLIEIPTVITTHQNADFDALAAAVGASLLYPEGRIVFAGSLNPNVREFVSLHGETLPIMNLRLIDRPRSASSSSSTLPIPSASAIWASCAGAPTSRPSCSTITSPSSPSGRPS